MKRRCDGTDPNLVDEQGRPCRCGLVFDDVERMVTYPHQRVGGGWILQDAIKRHRASREAFPPAGEGR